MARKQSDYLAALLADDEAIETKSENPESLSPDMAPPSPVQAESRRNERLRGSTLLGRESALARVNSGEVRQVTQLLLDPARVRVWTGGSTSSSLLAGRQDFTLAKSSMPAPRPEQ